MAELKAWFSNVTETIAGLRAGAGLGIDGPADGQGLAKQGYVGALPLWRGRRTDVCLLSDPRTAFEAWPVIIVKDGQALTLATNVSTALPFFLMSRMLIRNPEGRERFAGHWQSARAAALRLHEALGGKSETIQRFEELVLGASSHNEATPHALDEEKGISRLSRQIDSSPNFGTFADWLDDAVQGAVKLPKDQDFGPRTRLVFSWIANSGTKPERPSQLERLWSVVEENAGVDTGVSTLPTWATRPGAASGEATAIAAVEILEEQEPPRDPFRQGLLKAFGAEAMDYDGLAHAEAVPLLDERDEPERAWAALNSAAWWMARNLGEVASAVLDGTRLLCDRHGWEDIRWVVEQNAGAAA